MKDRVENNKKRSRILLACVFCVAIFSWLAVSVVGGYIRHSQFVQEFWWDGAKDYPLNEAPTVQKRNDLIQSLKEKVEENLMDKHPLYMDDVIFTKYIDKYFYHFSATTSSVNTKNNTADPTDLIISLETGKLAYLGDMVDYSFNVTSVVDFKQYIEKQGISFALFMPPTKHGQADPIYQGIYEDHFDELESSIVNELRSQNVNVIDYSDVLKNNGEDMDGLFFATDHHWLPQVGVQACAELGEYLNGDGFSIDTAFYNLDNYEMDYSYGPILGSQGRKTTTAYVDKEPFPLLHPLYDSDLTVFNSRLNKTTHGTIEETLYNYKELEKKSAYDKNPYGVYGYGDVALLQIHNNQKNDGKRLLVIKESFADCMTPYMCNMAENVDVIDLRYFHGSLKSYISNNKPDIVVMIYGVSPFLNVTEKTAHEDAFDFN